MWARRLSEYRKKMKNSITPPTFICPVCKKPYKRKYYYEKHILEKHDDILYNNINKDVSDSSYIQDSRHEKPNSLTENPLLYTENDIQCQPSPANTSTNDSECMEHILDPKFLLKFLSTSPTKCEAPTESQNTLCVRYAQSSLHDLLTKCINQEIIYSNLYTSYFLQPSVYSYHVPSSLPSIFPFFSEPSAVLAYPNNSLPITCENPFLTSSPVNSTKHNSPTTFTKYYDDISNLALNGMVDNTECISQSPLGAAPFTTNRQHNLFSGYASQTGNPSHNHNPLQSLKFPNTSSHVVDLCTTKASQNLSTNNLSNAVNSLPIDLSKKDSSAHSGKSTTADHIQQHCNKSQKQIRNATSQQNRPLYKDKHTTNQDNNPQIPVSRNISSAHALQRPQSQHIDPYFKNSNYHTKKDKNNNYNFLDSPNRKQNSYKKEHNLHHLPSSVIEHHSSTDRLGRFNNQHLSAHSSKHKTYTNRRHYSRRNTAEKRMEYNMLQRNVTGNAHMYGNDLYVNDSDLYKTYLMPLPQGRNFQPYSYFASS